MKRLMYGLAALSACGGAIFWIGLNSSERPLQASLVQPPQGSQPPGGPGFGGPGFGPPPFPLMEALDKNLDGEISAEELEAAPAALKSLDKNSDGKLGGEETMPQFPFGGGPGGGFGGPPGGMMGGANLKIVDEYDKDGDGRLNAEERKVAMEKMPQRGGRMGRGPGFGRQNQEPAQPGKQVSPRDVMNYPDAELYDTNVLRTLFLTFDSPNWEKEMETFNNTDVELPATLEVDGKTYPNVGVHFRGMSSFGMVPSSYKRSLNLTMDFVDEDQRLYGYKTLNLLNAHEDPSFMSSVLYSHIARQYTAAPKANFVRVVINGEDWGIYPSVQQFNKDFLKENYQTSKGSRWKVSGSPMGDGGLRYLGENIEEYRRRYDLKSEENEDAWKALVALCRTIDETPAEELEAALEPIVDLDSLIWFLALDCSLINNDGYWVRASDYSIYLSDAGKFHFIPHDMNEAFNGAMSGPGGGGRGGRGGFPGGPGGFPGGPGGFPGGPGGFPGGPGGFPGGPGGFPGGPGGFPGGERNPGDARPAMIQAGEPRGNQPPGFGGGPGFGGPGGPRGFGGGGTVELDPLTGMDDQSKPLRSKVLASPTLRTRYLRCVRTIAEKSMDWEVIGPFIAKNRELIGPVVEGETRKLTSWDEFQVATADAPGKDERAGRHLPLRTFFESRRTYLLAHAEIAKLDAVTAEPAQKDPVADPSEPALEVKPGSSILLNELLASNTASFADPQGEFDDWIELHNTSDKAVDLSGMHLSDSAKALTKWTFPEGSSIEPNGYLIVWADEDGKAEEGLHLSFKLSASGEDLYFVDRDGVTVLDQISFEKQTKDVAFGRFPAGAATWQPVFPTPAAQNKEHE